MLLGNLGGVEIAAADRPPLPEERGFPSIRSFTPRDYAAHNQIWTAEEGPDGVMYFGANDEVVTYDGINWRNIPVPGGVFIRAMDISADGTVWVGGVGEFGRIRPNDSDELEFTSLLPQLPPEATTLGDVRRVFVMPEGVYFQSDAYLLLWHDDQFQVWPMHERYVTLATRWEDRLIVSRESGWVMPLPNGEWEDVVGQPDRKLELLLSAMVATDENTWLGTVGPRGLMQYDGEQSTFVTGPVADALRESRLFGIARLADGRLLFPSLGKGLLITDSALRPLVHLDANSGLPSSTVICFTPTRDGIVWVGTEQGIARLDLAPGIGRFTPLNGLERNGANSVIRRDGEPVFATTLGPMRLRESASVATNPTWDFPVIVDDKLNTFYRLGDGLLAGGMRSMWWIDQNDQVTDLHSPSNISSIIVHPRFPDRVFALHLTGIAVWRRDGDQWSDFRTVPAPTGELQSFTLDDQDNLWVGSSNAGVWRLPYGSINPPAPGEFLADPVPIHYGAEAGLPLGKNRIVAREIGGRPLFLTSHGLFRFDPAMERFFADPDFNPGFADGTWTSHYIAESPQGGFWLEARLALPAPADGFRQFGKFQDGQWTPLRIANLAEIGSIDELVCETIDGDEILWICGRSGVIRVNTTIALSQNPNPVGPTIIHHVSSSSGHSLPRPATTETPVVVSPDANSLRFHFGTPGLAGEPDSQHVSRLIGFSGGTEEVSEGGERTFTNLPAGTYTFEVSGRTADHQWSTPARLELVVLAPWWATLWAKIIYGFLAAAAVYLIVLSRTHRLENQRQQLEQTVAERTRELAKKAKDLERLHGLEKDATLTARLAAETTRLELLRYQLNPHFLFNSLNSIRALVYTQPDTAGEMVSKLAEFCRRTLSRSGDEMVTVADEMEMARNYLDIEQVRWQEGLIVNIAIAPECLSCQLPQNLLLPLLENAIKYGGRTSPGTLEVSIEITQHDRTLYCVVSNSGRWIDSAENPFADSTHIGLQNLRQRLRRHYGEVATMSHDTDENRVSVRLKFPCLPPA